MSGVVPTLSLEEQVGILKIILTVAFIVTVLGMAKLHSMVCPDPSVHPKKEPEIPHWASRVGGDEECKLHSRRLSECMRLGYHKDDDDRPGWATCGQRGCLIADKHDHKKKEDR